MANRIKNSSADMIPNEMENELNAMMEDETNTNVPEKKTTKKAPTKRKSSSTTQSVEIKNEKPSHEVAPAVPSTNGTTIGQIEAVSARNEIVKGYKEKYNDIVKNITVDLNNIKISDSLNSMEKHTNMDIIFNSKPIFQVHLAQSCYSAFMSSLKLPEIYSLTQSSLDNFNSRLKLYQTIYSKIKNTSIGKMSFETFTELTSFFDLGTLMYGIYQMTFPGSTSIDITCGHCKQEFNAKIPNDSLIFSKDEDIFKRYDDISRNAKTVQDVIGNSLLSVNERVLLDDSKIIVDVRFPSLKDHLDTLRLVPSNQVDSKADALAKLLFIKSVMVLNVPATVQTGEPQYYPITDYNEIIKIIDELSVSDSKQLGNAMEDKFSKYNVQFRIKSFKCPKCGSDIGDIDVDMENLLFIQMYNL